MTLGFWLGDRNTESFHLPGSQCNGGVEGHIRKTSASCMISLGEHMFDLEDSSYEITV
jgi:hypothetical protein